MSFDRDLIAQTSTCMSTNTSRCASRGKQDDGIAHELYIVPQNVELPVSKLGLRGVELEPGNDVISSNHF